MDIPLKILKLDPGVTANGSMNLVHIIIDAFIHSLDPPGNQHLTVQLSGLVSADQALQFFDQGAALVLGDEFGGLHRVHQQLQLRQLEGASSNSRLPI